MKAEDHIKAGDLDAALGQLQSAVRDDPANPAYRTFLFQLLCVKGDWNRALTQLNVVADMDSSTLLMAQTYRELLLCEAFRAQVFEGRRAPLLFGQPNTWLGKLVQALSPAHQGDSTAAQELISAALDDAPARAGHIDDQPFEWISDADMRLGPVLEIILNGKYYWAPMDAVAQINWSAPEDLRDLVWLPVTVQWVNEGKTIGFMPTRYPGEQTLSDPLKCLARKTDWQDIGNALHAGGGQRMFTTDQSEYSLLSCSHISFTEPTVSAPETSA